MEAMKMEIEIVAPATGTIASIEVSPGDSVTPDTVLANIE
jgi:biotin carboxyl carrier protein